MNRPVFVVGACLIIGGSFGLWLGWPLGQDVGVRDVWNVAMILCMIDVAMGLVMLYESFLD